MSAESTTTRPAGGAEGITFPDEFNESANGAMACMSSAANVANRVVWSVLGDVLGDVLDASDVFQSGSQARMMCAVRGNTSKMLESRSTIASFNAWMMASRQPCAARLNSEYQHMYTTK